MFFNGKDAAAAHETETGGNLMDFSLVGLLAFATITLAFGCFLILHALWQLLDGLSWIREAAPGNGERILRSLRLTRSVRSIPRVRPRSLQNV